jgi:hypothetical protein
MPKRRNIACTTTYDTVLRHGVGRSDTRRPFVGNVDTDGLHLADEERDKGLHLRLVEESIERNHRPSLQSNNEYE